MPEEIVPSTMYSEGADGIRVLTTRFSTRQVVEDTSEERRKLETEKEKYQVIGARIDSESAACQKNMDMLTKLEGIAEKSSTRSGDEIIAMSKYVMEQRVEKAKELVALKEQKRLNDIQVNFVHRRMDDPGHGSAPIEPEALLLLDP